MVAVPTAVKLQHSASSELVCVVTSLLNLYLITVASPPFEIMDISKRAPWLINEVKWFSVTNHHITLIHWIFLHKTNFLLWRWRGRTTYEKRTRNAACRDQHLQLQVRLYTCVTFGSKFIGNNDQLLTASGRLHCEEAGGSIARKLAAPLRGSWRLHCEEADGSITRKLVTPIWILKHYNILTSNTVNKAW